MLEKMAAFFEARLDGYDNHMLTNIQSSREFYPFTAKCLPIEPDASLLDLGCGTGLELEFYFQYNPTAVVTGVDLSEGMLKALRSKFPTNNLTLLWGSYFDLPFETNKYDAAVSVESLHHFKQAQKTTLYQKLFHSLKEKGYFILTDYFAKDDEEEHFLQNELIRLKKENWITDDAFYHFDTPLTVFHETEALKSAGFSEVEILNSWAATYTLKAIK